MSETRFTEKEVGEALRVLVAWGREKGPAPAPVPPQTPKVEKKD